MFQENIRSKGVLIGRDRELGQLRSLYQDVVRHKKPRIALVNGDFGTGKTYLVERFLVEIQDKETNDQVKEREKPIIGRAVCSLEEELNGLYPFAKVTQSLGDQSLKLRIISSNWLGFIKQVAPAWLDIVTLGIADATVKTIEAGGQMLGTNIFSQTSVFEQFSNLLRKIAAKRVVVIFIDDLHWADISSARLIYHLLRNLEDAPILILTTYRTVSAEVTNAKADVFQEIVSGIERYHYGQQITLEQGIQVREYVQERFPGLRLSDALVDKIQGFTGGQPLFISELCNLWENDGKIQPKISASGLLTWGFSGKDDQLELQFLHSITEVVEARLRILPEELQIIMLYASVDGQEFSAQTLASISGKDIEQIYLILNQLEKSYRFIDELGPVELSTGYWMDYYKFHHPFFQEYIYTQQLSKGYRRLLHARLAEFFKDIYQVIPAKAGLIAKHSREASRYLDAMDYALKAARHELSQANWAEAGRWCIAGLEVLAQEQVVARLGQGGLKEREIVFYEILGDAYFEQGEYKKAFDPYYVVLDMAEELKLDPLFLSKINIKLGDTADEEGLEIDQISKYYHQALEVLSDAPNSFEKSYREIHAEQLLAYISERQGDCETVIPKLSYLLTRAQILGQVAETDQQRDDLTKLILDIYNNMGISYGNRGFFNHSVPMFVKAIDLAEARHNPRCTTFYLNMVDDLIRIGDFERAIQTTQKAMDMARRNGNLDDQAFAEQSLGTICLMKKEYQNAVKHLQDSIELAERIKAEWNIGYQYADLALAFSGLELHAQAIEAVEKACLYAVNRNYQYELAYTVLARALVHNQAGDWETAQGQFKQALELLADKHYLYLYARCRREYGTALAEHGELQQGREHLNAALEIFSELEIEVHSRLTEDALKRFGQNPA